MAQAVGVGYTPEGLDQNPAFYELLQEAAFKAAPETDVTAWLVRRAHRRYGLNSGDVDVTQAWAELAASGYANDAPVDDTTNVGKVLPQATLPAWMGFESGGGTRPKPALCKEWSAWSSLISAAARVPRPLPQTFTYDLVDVGREVLSQLTIPLSRNFSSALGLLHTATQGADAKRPDTGLSAARIKETGDLYVQTLNDLDTLLATDSAFLLGTWLESARKLGGNSTDCTDTVLADKLSRCDDFMEWNARAQITTWHPTGKKTLILCAIFILKTISVTREARDKQS